MIPTAELNINIEMNERTAKNIHMRWNFSDVYSARIVTQYDKNKNGELDKKELDAVLGAMLDYLTKKKMLTKVQYAKKGEKMAVVEPEYKNFDLKMQNKLLVFTYDSLVNFEVEKKSTLSLLFEDDEAYFSFVILNVKLDGSKLGYDPIIYLFTASVFFNDKSPNLSAQTRPKNEAKPTYFANAPKIKNADKDQSAQANILKKSIVKIKALFESIKENKDPLSYTLLLFFAYLYGLIHALGPGHGKTLVASYFLSNDRSYSKALFISVAIAVVHTFSAFLLTLVIYFLVNTFLASFMNDAIFYTTKISALIIISIAAYLIYTKYKAYKALRRASQSPSFAFSATPHVVTCACSSCKVDNNSTDFALIVSAGIIPCPGTTTIFIFALSLGLYAVGFVSALVMSMGMSTIIFVSALLSVAIRKKTTASNSNVKKYLEYASLIIILALGVALLFA